MLEHNPVRRDPRLLVFVIDVRIVRYAAVDAWEVYALGKLEADPRAVPLALWRLLARARPSHLLLVLGGAGRSSGVVRLVRRHAVRHGLPLCSIDRPEGRTLAAEAPAFALITRAYPELRHVIAGPQDPLLRAVRIALGALLTRSLPPRRYVPGLSSRTPPRVDG